MSEERKNDQAQQGQSQGQGNRQRQAGPPPGPTDAPARAGDRGPLPPVTIEVNESRNNNVMFLPLSENLRGRWDAHRLNPGDQSIAGLHRIPVIPGLHVSVIAADRMCRVDDPLEMPGNRQLLAEINSVHKQIFKRELTFKSAVVRQPVDDDEMATWVYWMMRLVKGGLANVVTGSLPRSDDELAEWFPGAKVRRKFFNAVEQMTANKAKNVLEAALAVAGEQMQS